MRTRNLLNNSTYKDSQVSFELLNYDVIEIFQLAIKLFKKDGEIIDYKDRRDFDNLVNFINQQVRKTFYFNTPVNIINKAVMLRMLRQLLITNFYFF